MKTYDDRTYRLPLELDGVKTEMLVRLIWDGGTIKAVRALRLRDADGSRYPTVDSTLIEDIEAAE